MNAINVMYELTYNYCELMVSVGMRRTIHQPSNKCELSDTLIERQLITAK